MGMTPPMKMAPPMGMEPANCKNATTAADTVADKLMKLWQLGDARIPLLQRRIIAKNVANFHADLAFLCPKS